VRPGGRLVVHEIPDGSGYPALTPPVPALRRAYELLYAGVEAAGGRHAAVQHLGALAREVGVQVLGERAFAWAAEPRSLLDNARAVLRSIRGTVVGHGLVTEREVDGLLEELERAKTADYVSAFGSLYVEVIAEIPAPPIAAATTPDPGA
jgi:hypothetical protein